MSGRLSGRARPADWIHVDSFPAQRGAGTEKGAEPWIDPAASVHDCLLGPWVRVELGTEIPRELYLAVAKVLAFAWAISGKSLPEAGHRP